MRGSYRREVNSMENLHAVIGLPGKIQASYFRLCNNGDSLQPFQAGGGDGLLTPWMSCCLVIKSGPLVVYLLRVDLPNLASDPLAFSEVLTGQHPTSSLNCSSGFGFYNFFGQRSCFAKYEAVLNYCV